MKLLGCFFQSCTSLRRHHKWFLSSVSKWLDIALFKSLRRIRRAVDIDNLGTVDDMVRYTNSAVDVR